MRIPHRGPTGLALAAAIGREQDAELALARVALLCRASQRCPDDALDLLGLWYRLPRYPGEDDATYRARLVAAWETWALAGSPEGVEAQLRAAGLVDVHLYQAYELAFLPASPIGYDPNRSPPWYSAFIVVLGPDFGDTGIAPLHAPFAGGPQTTSGSTATRLQVETIAGIILRWKAHHSYPVGVVLRFGTTALGGINTTAPFTPAAVPEYAFWNIGKLQGVNIFNGPFVPGGYEF